MGDSQMITAQDLQDAADKLKQQELPRQLHNKVLVGTQAFKYLDYLATKYPNGATLVKRIDKKRFKNKSKFITNFLLVNLKHYHILKNTLKRTIL